MGGIENNDIPGIGWEKVIKKTLTEGRKIAIVTLNILNIYDYKVFGNPKKTGYPNKKGAR